MLKRMHAKVMFDREIVPDIHIVSPGGYEMVFGERSVKLDFKDYYGYMDSNDQRILNIEHESLDVDVFPEAMSITVEDTRNLKRILEFYIYTGENDDPVIHPLKLMSLEFEFDDGTMIDCTDTKAVKGHVFEWPFMLRCYEAYKLEWMIQHGYSLRDLSDIIRGLATEEVEEYPISIPTDETSVNALADGVEKRFRQETGFGSGSLYVCMEEFINAEFCDKDYMTHLISMMPDAEKNMKIWQEITGIRRGADPDIEKILTLSTIHITPETDALLNEDIGDSLPGICVYPKIGMPVGVILKSSMTKITGSNYGWWIHIPQDDVSPDLRELKGLPTDLFCCIKYAFEHGCEWLCLDCAGATVQDLPEYDW